MYREDYDIAKNSRLQYRIRGHKINFHDITQNPSLETCLIRSTPASALCVTADTEVTPAVASTLTGVDLRERYSVAFPLASDSSSFVFPASVHSYRSHSRYLWEPTSRQWTTLITKRFIASPYQSRLYHRPDEG